MPERDFKTDVLRRVGVLDSIGRRLTIPALIRELIDDRSEDAYEAAFECAVRDFDRERLVSCKNGVVLPTTDGFQIRGGSPASGGDEAASAVAEQRPHRAYRGAAG